LKLQRLQDKVIRIVVNLSRRKPTHNLQVAFKFRTCTILLKNYAGSSYTESWIC